MAIAVRTETSGGDLLVLKEARSDDDLGRLTGEAAILRHAQHPGIVELVSVHDDAIVLRHAGTSLAQLGPLPLAEAAGVSASVAEVLHTLHRADVVHRAIEADHVLVDRRGRVRLCGFGRAERIEDAVASMDAADDVAALGRLLDHVIERADLGAGRAGTRRRRRRALRALVAQATHSDPVRRPSARQLAKSIHRVVPDLALPDAPAPRSSPTGVAADVDPTDDLIWTTEDVRVPVAPDPSDPADDQEATHETLAPTTTAERPDTDGSDPRRRMIVGASAGLVLVAGLVAGMAGARAIAPFGSGSSAAAGTAATTTTTPSRSTTTSVPPPGVERETTAAAVPTEPSLRPPAWPSRCDVAGPAGPDVDGDGCPEPVRWSGRTATIGAVRVTVGDEGDLLALGDWTCDAIATPALLRPSTGEVFVFREWRFDEVVEVAAIAEIPEATSIRAGDGLCPHPVVVTPSRDVPVELPS